MKFCSLQPARRVGSAATKVEDVKNRNETISIDGQRLKVRITRGKGVPLLIFNGIGANLECLEPLTNALDGIETIVFDLPGVGGSDLPTLPYGLRGLPGSPSSCSTSWAITVR